MKKRGTRGNWYGESYRDIKPVIHIGLLNFNKNY